MFSWPEVIVGGVLIQTSVSDILNALISIIKDLHENYTSEVQCFHYYVKFSIHLKH